jgi:hypothetical protein
MVLCGRLRLTESDSTLIRTEGEERTTTLIIREAQTRVVDGNHTHRLVSSAIAVDLLHHIKIVIISQRRGSFSV